MFGGFLYTIVVVVLFGVQLIWPEMYVPNLALSLLLPMVIEGKVGHSFIVMSALIVFTDMTSESSLGEIGLMYLVWFGLVVGLQKILSEMWLVQGMVAALLLAFVQWSGMAGFSGSALFPVSVQGVVNAVWFSLVLLSEYRYEWYTKFFE